MFDQFISSDGQRICFSGYAFLLLICCAFFIPGLVNLPPTDRDESSFAQASKQMIESGNYVDIRLQDKPRYKKPIGIYWLQVAAVRMFNVENLNEIWAYRLPSFIGATVAVLTVAALGSLLFDPVSGLLAAIMMAGCVILNVEARLAKTDAALLGCVVVAQYALARARQLSLSRQAVGWGIGLTFWTALGVGILIKGPIILLVVLSTVLWIRVTEKEIKWFKGLRPFFGFPYLMVLTAPWFVAIVLQSHGQFLHDSAGQDMAAKIWQGQDRGFMPPGLHLLALPIVFFPFSLFAFLAVPDVWKNRQNPSIRFCLGWLVPTWIIFELALTKLPHYTLPLYPAIALVAAKFLRDGFPSLGATKWRWFLTLTVGLWLTIGVGFAFTFILLPYVVDQTWNPGQIVVGMALLLAQGASLFLLVQRKTSGAIIVMVGSLVFMGWVFGNTLPNLQHMWVSRDVMRLAIAHEPCKNFQIISASYDEPSLTFLAGTKTKYSSDGAAAAKELMRDACAMVLTDASHDRRFQEAFTGIDQQPAALGHIVGFNIGHGQATDLTLYRTMKVEN
jgi:4-amino-4-deoxy-L-arabinose transferase-like glycosyltransferase